MSKHIHTYTYIHVLTHSNTGTPGTVTCLPVAAVECLKLKR